MILSIFNSLIIYIILILIKNKNVIRVFFSFLTLIFIINYLYFVKYNTFITINVLINSFDILKFSNMILVIIKDNFLSISYLLFPLILLVLLIEKIEIKKEKIGKYLIVTLISYLLIISSLFISSNSQLYSNKNLYFKIDFPIKNLYNFGLLTSIRLDIERKIFNINEINYKTEPKKIDNREEYNILDTDFKKANNDEINNYLKNKLPMKKNLYTGILKDKNLIFILAESFNTISINKAITPNLYKLYSEGYKFNNFYNPLFPVSTADGQYMLDTGLYPADSTHSLIAVNDNYLPNSLGNQFKKNDYNTYSYHNYYYDYYNRDKYYKTSGYDTYKAIGNGLKMKDLRSDYEMAKVSIDDYINKDKFLVYYLTISGHAPYNKDNVLVKKNYKKLENYNYSDKVKYFLSTQMELDKMVGYLLKRLKDENKLDDTVIVLVPDHIPYDLSIQEINELSFYKKDEEFEKYKSEFIIYNKDINKYEDNDNYSSNIDVLPTLLNLFGIEYDSRLMMGRDINSNDDGIVIFGNRNIVTKDYKYSNLNDVIDGDISLEEIEKIKEETYMKFKISRLILENDYYKYLYGME